jgi:vanillate O-demethylase ferredoxin subunit
MAQAHGGFAPARVRAARDVARDVRLLEIEPEGGTQPYPTGSHLDIAVLVGELPDVRSYSLVGRAPRDGAYRIAVKEVSESRGGSLYVRALEGGARVEVSAPRSHFELAHGRPEYLLVAGGIGITPLVGMVEALAERGTAYRLLYAARERAQMPFVDELRELAGDRLVLLASDEGRRLDVAAEIAALHPDGEVYLCGPLRLRDAAQRAWRQAGRPPDRLRFETFASGGRFAPEAFLVRLRDGEAGREVRVPENRTMLDALRDAGVDVMWDCLRGECGLCAVDVLAVEGELDHRDVFLSDEQQAEGRKLCTCVSRAVGGAVTIDIGFRARQP